MANMICERCGEPIADEEAGCLRCEDLAIEVASRDSAAPAGPIGWPGVVVALIFIAAIVSIPGRGIAAMLLAIALATNLVVVLPYVLLPKLWRVKIEDLALGLGPAAIRVRSGGILYRLNAIPVGAYAKYKAVEDYRIDPDSILALHPAKRIILSLSGPTAALLLALMLMGSTAIPEFASGFRQSLELLWGNTATLRSALRPYLESVARRELAGATGLFAAKFAAFELLPLTAGAGSRVVLWTIEWVRGRPLQPRTETVLSLLWTLLLLTWIGRLLYILVPLLLARAS